VATEGTVVKDASALNLRFRPNGEVRSFGHTELRTRAHSVRHNLVLIRAGVAATCSIFEATYPGEQAAASSRRPNASSFTRGVFRRDLNVTSLGQITSPQPSPISINPPVEIPLSLMSLALSIGKAQGFQL